MEEIFLRLLRVGAMGEDFEARELPESIDWEAVIDMAEKQSVLFIVADAIAKLPAALQPDRQQLIRLKKLTSCNVGYYDDHAEAVAALTLALRAVGIDSILLKGLGVAQMYPQPYLRGCGDIDLYVGRANFDRAVETLLKLEHIVPGGHSYSEKHLDLRYKDVPVELHRMAVVFGTPWRNKRWLRLEQALLDEPERQRHCTLGGCDVAMPSVDFDAIYLFLHAWKHLVNGGIGMRHLCDWGLHMRRHHSEIDAALLRERLERFGLMRQWSILAWGAIEKLGLTPEEMVVYDARHGKLGQRAYDIICEGGNFGHHSSAGAEYGKRRGVLARKLVMVRWLAANSLTLLRFDPVEGFFGYLHRARIAILDLARKR